MIDLAQLVQLVGPAAIAAAASFAGSWAAMRLQLRHVAREAWRANKRLDLIRAPNVTPDAVDL